MEQLLGMLLLMGFLNILTVLPVLILWLCLKRVTSWLTSRRWARGPAQPSFRLEPWFSPPEASPLSGSVTSNYSRAWTLD